MEKEKETKKLSAEELEKRVAPLTVQYSDSGTPAGDAPTQAPGTGTPPEGGDPGGGGGGGPFVE